MARVKALFGLAVVVGGIYLAIMLLPPYFANYQFQDDVSTIAKFSSVSMGKSDDDILADVMKKVKEHDLPIRSEQIKISHSERQITISVDYDVVVELVGGRTQVLSFHVASK
ncbi:MAG: DUF4845 domain-containing protein [Acidobacteriales bacterium]|nr:DUF4845 domain-containing protein [Terriglobales bacterium]